MDPPLTSNHDGWAAGRRGATGRETVIDGRKNHRARQREAEQIQGRLDSCKVSFDFTGKPVREVVEFILKPAQVSYVFEERAQSRNTSSRITLSVTDMPANHALKWVLKLAELDYVIIDEAV